MARSRGVDITKQGSGNIGASNVARTLGKKSGARVLFLDALKGLVPTLIATRWSVEVACLAGMCAVLGHVFSVWLRFKGGKGVATGLGVFLALSPWAALLAVGVYALLVVWLRISSIASLAAAGALPLFLWLFAAPRAVLVLAAVVLAIIVARHRENLQRLARHKEPRV